jgi:uncharacterized membrane protein YjgN (DUF898 family)
VALYLDMAVDRDHFWPVFPLGLLSPATMDSEHTFIDNRQLAFHGTGFGFFWNWVLIMVLTLITFGLYMPWGFCRLKRWQTNNLSFGDGGQS